MEDSLLNSSVYWIMNNKRRIVAFTFLVLIVALIVNFFMNYAFVNVTVVSTIDANTIVTYAASDKPNKEVGKTGIMLVPRDTKSLVVTSGANIKTEANVDIPWYGFADKKVELRRDKNATKVAYRSTVGAECATYDPQRDGLSYYDCDNAKNLVNYQTPNVGIWQNKQIASFYYPNGKALPYLGGVIGLSRSNLNYSEEGVFYTKLPTAGDITVISSTGQSSTLNSPDSITDKSQFNFSGLYTNTNNPRDKHFVIATVKGDIYIGTPTGGKTVDYHRIAAPVDYDSSHNQTLCSLYDQGVYCYRGKTAYGDVSPNFDYSKVTGSQIVHYSYMDKSVQTTKLTKDLFALGQFQTTIGGELYATYYKELYRFVKSNDTYTAEPISQNANAIAAADVMYYIQDKGVFAVDQTDKTTSYQVFYSKNVIPKSLYAVAGKLYIIGSIPGDESVTYAYLLGSDDDTQPGNRAIDILPIASKDLPGAYLNDLVGQRVFVMLDLNVTTSKPTSAEIEEKKRQIVQKLSLYGSSINASNIQFAY